MTLLDPAPAPLPSAGATGAPGSGRSSRRGRRVSGVGRGGWVVAALLVAALVAAPIVAVVVDGLRADTAVPARLPEMLLNTLALILGVGVGTLLVGGGLAWLVTVARFPGRDLFTWLLVLPLAMPAYILGFVFLSTLDEAGPVQSALRDTFGDGLWLPPVRSLGGAVVVMTLTLFPYVYLMARAAFSEQSASTYDAARSLGASRTRALRHVVLPLARPSLAAGLALVAMEVLTDFATVQYFGVQTISVGVYNQWKGGYDFESASRLSVLVLLFAVAVLVAERGLRGRARFTQRGGRGRGLEAVTLTGWRAAAAVAACLLALSVAFLLPVARLVGWAVGEARRESGALVDPRFAEYLANTLTVAVTVAAVCVVLSLVVAHAQRVTSVGRLLPAAAQVTTFGYAVPGAVLGIGVLLVFSDLDRLVRALGVEGGTGLLVTGSVARDPLRLRHPLPRPGLPGRRRQPDQGVGVHDRLGAEPGRPALAGAHPGAPAAGPLRGLRGLRAGAGRRRQGAAPGPAPAPVRVQYRVGVGLRAGEGELLGEGGSPGAGDRRDGGGAGLPAVPPGAADPRRGAGGDGPMTPASAPTLTTPQEAALAEPGHRPQGSLAPSSRSPTSRRPTARCRP